jgi:hypothetical protein
LFNLPQSSAFFGFPGFATFRTRISTTRTPVFHPLLRPSSVLLELARPSSIYFIYLICLSTFDCPLIMIALMSEPYKINFRCEKRKPGRDLQRWSEQEVQNQKDELTAPINERMQRPQTSG